MSEKKFLWGNSVSSMQTEGAWNVDGKGPSVYDVKAADENLVIGRWRLMSITDMMKILN